MSPPGWRTGRRFAARRYAVNFDDGSRVVSFRLLPLPPHTATTTTTTTMTAPPPPSSSSACCVAIQAILGRGRGLVTTRDVAAGQVVIAEEPLLLTVLADAKDAACANCLCWLEGRPGATACQQCHQASFCSSACAQAAAARPWVHAAATCRAYAAIPQLLPGDAEAQTNLRGLIQAAALKAAAAATSSDSDARAGSTSTSLAQQCAAAFQVLLSLVGEPSPATTAAAAVLHPALCKAIGDPGGALLSLPEVAALLAKEQLNSYGLLAPLEHQQAQQQQQGQQGHDSSSSVVRRLRGGAIYPLCALINHECLPNVARFDALDAAATGTWPAQWPGRPDSRCQQQEPAAAAAAIAGPDSAAVAAAGLSACCSDSSSSTTLVVMRALHALPRGTEVVGSYFPLNWGLDERQAQAQQVYGFACSCPRCLLEGSPQWQAAQGNGSSDGEWETDSGSGDEPDGDEPAAEDAAAAGAAGDGMVVEEAAGTQQQQEGGQEQPPLEPAYLSLFLLKYLCPRPGCCGTMAALAAEQGAGGEVLECSVCGGLRSEAEFLAELEAGV